MGGSLKMMVEHSTWHCAVRISRLVSVSDGNFTCVPRGALNRPHFGFCPPMLFVDWLVRRRGRSWNLMLEHNTWHCMFRISRLVSVSDGNFTCVPRGFLNRPHFGFCPSMLFVDWLVRRRGRSWNLMLEHSPWHCAFRISRLVLVRDGNFTCPAGMKMKSNVATTKCTTDAASCAVGGTCCENDALKCGGIGAIGCTAATYYQGTSDAWKIQQTPRQTKSQIAALPGPHALHSEQPHQLHLRPPVALLERRNCSLCFGMPSGKLPGRLSFSNEMCASEFQNNGGVRLILHFVGGVTPHQWC